MSEEAKDALLRDEMEMHLKSHITDVVQTYLTIVVNEDHKLTFPAASALRAINEKVARVGVDSLTQTEVIWLCTLFIERQDHRLRQRFMAL